jgi:translation initiation factor 4G
VSTNRSPIIPPPAPRKVIAIIDPLTGNPVNTNPMSLTSASPVSSTTNLKQEEKLDFKVPVPHVSKAVNIVDPAIRDRELREKREREEAEQEALRKAEEEKLEAERKEKERIEKEIADKLEAERLEAERLEKERIETERIETERRLKAEADAIAKAEAEAEQKRLEEEEARRKAEEEKELKRVMAEIEVKKRREEQDRIIAAEVASQKIGRVPTAIDISSVPKFTQSPVSSPATITKKPSSTTPMKVIEDPSKIQYPVGIQAPAAKQETEGKLTYTIDFLLQFQQICLETDEDLSAIMNEMSESSGNRGGNNGSMRQHSERGRGGPRTPGVSNMGGDSMFRMGSRDGRMEMGKFNMGRPLTARTGSTHMERQ